MSLQAWLAKAAAMGKKVHGGIEDAILGKEGYSLGKAAGFEMPRRGGLFGEGGVMPKVGEGVRAAGAHLGAGADRAEEFIGDHPHVSALGAGLLGGGLGGAGYLASQEDDDDQGGAGGAPDMDQMKHLQAYLRQHRGGG